MYLYYHLLLIHNTIVWCKKWYC